MARTQAADYDDKRLAMMEQAAALFAEKGFAGASIADLAGRCGISKSLIYHYYSAKEDILYDAMQGHMDDLLSVVRADDLNAGDPTAALHRFTRDLLRHYVGAANRQKILLYELNALPAALQDEIRAKQRRIIAHVEKLVIRARPAAGAVDPAQLRAAVMLFFGMLNWTHTWFRGDRAVSRDALADMAAQSLLAMFR